MSRLKLKSIKLFESKTQIVYRGSDDDVISEMHTVLSKKKMLFVIYDTIEEIQTLQLPESDYLVVWAVPKEMSNDDIINRQQQMENHFSKSNVPYIPVAGPKRGRIKLKL